MDTDTAWDLWGARDPYYGVLSDPKFRATAMNNQSREEFFASGRGDSDHVLAMCQRCAGPAYSPQRILDFGCGVGRMLIPFSSIATSVVGVDISPSMLLEAQRNCAERGLTNVTFAKSDDCLSAVDGDFDLVHSSIVLQHIAIDRGRELFETLVRRVSQMGCGAIHVTFGWDAYPENFGFPLPPPQQPEKTALLQLRSWFRNVVGAMGARKNQSDAIDKSVESDPEMQMNFYNLSELMFIVQRAGVGGVYSQFTNHGGALGVYLVFQRCL